MLPRAPELSFLVWSLCGVPIACGSSGESNADAAKAGADGDATTQTGGAALGQAGQSTGGTRSDDPGTGGAVPGQAGESNGGSSLAAGGTTTIVGSGGAESGQAGQGTSGNTPVEGLPDAASFTRLTIRTKQGYPSGEGGACQNDSYESVSTFDRASETLTWDLCVGDPGVLERGEATLTDAEVQAILNSLSLLTPGSVEECRADGASIELELELDDRTTLYHNDSSWCEAASSDAIYVDGLDAFAVWFRWRPIVELPATPKTLWLSTGAVSQDPRPGSNCLADRSSPDYKLDVGTGKVTWIGCIIDPESGEETVTTSSHVLDANEVDSLLNGYRELVLGASGPCNSLERPESLDDPTGRVASAIADGLVLVDGECQDSCRMIS